MGRTTTNSQLSQKTPVYISNVQESPVAKKLTAKVGHMVTRQTTTIRRNQGRRNRLKKNLKDLNRGKYFFIEWPGISSPWILQSRPLVWCLQSNITYCLVVSSVQYILSSGASSPVIQKLFAFPLPSTPPSLLLYPPSSTTSPVPLVGVTLYLLLISMISTLHYYITRRLIADI